jgi:hypothetical protein
VQVPWLGVTDTNVTPAGNVSVKLTPVAVLGPALLTLTVYVSVLAATTGSGESVLVTLTSAEAVTVVVALALLFALLGSDSLAVTVAVLVIVPPALGAVTVIVTVADPPLAIPPRLHVTVPALWLQVPWVAVADTKPTPAGNVSVKVTPVAPLGPALLTLTVYVSVLAATTGSGESVLVTERSAEAVTVVLAVVLLLPAFGSFSVAVTLALLVSVPPEVGTVTVMVTVALDPLAIVPKLQVTVPAL